MKKKKDESKNVYVTNSLALASFLHSKEEIKFAGVNKENARVLTFVFKPKAKAQVLADQYFSNEALVNPLELFKNHRVLKDLIFETKRNINGYESDRG